MICGRLICRTLVHSEHRFDTGVKVCWLITCCSRITKLSGNQKTIHQWPTCFLPCPRRPRVRENKWSNHDTMPFSSDAPASNVRNLDNPVDKEGSNEGTRLISRSRIRSAPRHIYKKCEMALQFHQFHFAIASHHFSTMVCDT